MELFYKIVSFLLTAVFTALFCQFFSWYKKESANIDAIFAMIQNTRREKEKNERVDEEIRHLEKEKAGYYVKQSRAKKLSWVFGGLSIIGLITCCFLFVEINKGNRATSESSANETETQDELLIKIQDASPSPTKEVGDPSPSLLTTAPTDIIGELISGVPSEPVSYVVPYLLGKDIEDAGLLAGYVDGCENPVLASIDEVWYQDEIVIWQWPYPKEVKTEKYVLLLLGGFEEDKARVYVRDDGKMVVGNHVFESEQAFVLYLSDCSLLWSEDEEGVLQPIGNKFK